MSTVSQPKSPQPTQLGPYKVTAYIGSGGMGDVYRARDSRMSRDVAVKVLAPSTVEGGSRVRRFEQEARAAGALNHPNLLSVYDVGVEGERPYLVSELLEGKTLQEQLSSGALSVSKALDYAVQIARGIDAAHTEGIVHRDLKPANIFVTTRGHIKILDFGIAKLTRESEVPDETLPSNTAEGAILGTTGYMSPEQVQGRSTDHRADIFSFGVVLHEMLSGEKPFRGVSAIETAYATVRDDPPSISELKPKAPLQLSRIVSRCLEKNPEQRFQTAGDLAFHLETITDLSSSRQGHELPASTRTSSRWPFALVALALALLLFVVSRSESEPKSRSESDPALVVKAAALVSESVGFDRITFRRGTISAARFAPDGVSVYYTASWGKEPMQLYRTQSESSGSLALGHAGHMLYDVSASGQLAVGRATGSHRGFVHPGTLAVVPLGGGGLREVRERVIAADFAPNSDELAVVTVSKDFKSHLEYPLGTMLLESPGWISHPRVSPGGDKVAFIEHASPLDDRGAVAVVDLKGNKSTLSTEKGSVQGLAWAPDGQEVWFSAAESGTTRGLWAVNLSGNARMVTQTPGMLTLQDIASDGRVLLTRDDSRTFVHARLSGKDAVEDLSWFDWSLLVDIAKDGKSVFFIEAGAAAGSSYELFSRSGADEPAVRLTSEVHLPVSASPDGKWVLAAKALNSNVLKLVPTGAGSERIMKIEGAQMLFHWAWLGDSQHVLVQGLEEGKEIGEEQARLWRLEVATGNAELLSWADGLLLAGKTVRSDGSMIMVDQEAKTGYLYSADGERMQELELEPKDHSILGWIDDKDLLLRDRDLRSINLYRYDLSANKMSPYKELARADAAGKTALEQVMVVDDAYAYSFMSSLSELYIVRNLL